MKENEDEFNIQSSEVTELDIWFETAELYFQLEAVTLELEELIKSIRNVLDTEEAEDLNYQELIRYCSAGETPVI